MKIVIDDERCEGHGRCYSLAPGVFEPDEIGDSVLVDPSGSVPPALEEVALLAQANCPEHAITIDLDA